MDGALISYAVAMIGFGTATGVEVKGTRAHALMGAGSWAVGTVSFLIDAGLYIYAFAMLTTNQAIALSASGIVGSAFLMSVLPAAAGWVVIPAIIGAAGLISYMVA